MEREDISYTPLIDAQIDELIQNVQQREQTHRDLADAPELRMTQDIRRVYQAEADEDQRSLERVLTRLVAADSVNHAAMVPFVKNYQEQKVKKGVFRSQDAMNTAHAMQTMPHVSSHGARQRGWKFSVSLLAATLLIGLVIGSFLVVLNMAHSGIGTVAPHATVTPKLATGPVGTIVYKGNAVGTGIVEKWSPDGNRIAGNDGSVAETWDAFTGTYVTTYRMPFPGSNVGVGGWSPDGSKVAFYNQESITIFNAQTAVPLQSLRPLQSLPTQNESSSLGGGDLTWSPDGKSLAMVINTCHGIGTLESCASQMYVWDLASNQIIVKRDMHGFYGSLTWSPNGQYVAAISEDTNSSASTLQLWSSVSWQVVKSYANITDFSWSPDGNELAMVHVVQALRPSDGATVSDVQIVDIASERVLRTFAQSLVLHVFWQPGGSRLAVVSTATFNSPGYISLWDVNTGAQLYTFTTYFSAEMLWSPDGKYIECFPIQSLATPNPPGVVIWIAD